MSLRALLPVQASTAARLDAEGDHFVKIVNGEFVVNCKKFYVSGEQQRPPACLLGMEWLGGMDSAACLLLWLGARWQPSVLLLAHEADQAHNWPCVRG